jgi:hypothetical protein
MGEDPNRREEHLLEIVPEDLSVPYDMPEVIHCIVDHGKFLELQKNYAPSLIIGFARLDGQTVGMIANNPAEESGILTLNTCDKQTRFIRWRDAFSVPSAGYPVNSDQKPKTSGPQKIASPAMEETWVDPTVESGSASKTIS